MSLTIETNSDPWVCYPSIWPNQSAFFNYLRGQLRSTWSRYPAKLKWKNNQAVKPPSDYKGKAKKLGQCAYCKQWFGISSLEVDHIKQAGKCNSWETAYQFLHNLLDCNNNWCLSCKPCHKVKSYAEKQNISFDEALIEKEVIRICKEPIDKVKDFCYSYGYDDSQINNVKKRREVVYKILKGKTDD